MKFEEEQQAYPEAEAREFPEEERLDDAAEASKDAASVVDETTEVADDAAAQQGNFENAEEVPAEEPEDETAKLKKNVAELEDKYLRCRAEFDNYRKRMAREFTETREQMRRSTVTDFLTVYDYFAMGMVAIDQAADLLVLKQGMTMIWNEFQKVLDGLGVKKLESVGKPFDARYHEAVSQEASETVPEGTILREWKPAFMMGDKLLRPAVVVVSSGPAPAKDVTEEAADNADAASPQA